MPMRPTDGAGVETMAGAAAGPASTSDVRIQIGEARYHVIGMPTARATARAIADRPGCRRAAANHPRRQAMRTIDAATTAETAAIGKR